MKSDGPYTIQQDNPYAPYCKPIGPGFDRATYGIYVAIQLGRSKYDSASRYLEHLNVAYKEGYAAALADVRKALGVDK